MSEKLWEDQCKFLRAELAQVQASRQQLDEAHKEASHRLLHSEAELAQCRGELAAADDKAVAAVLCIRCIEHISVPQQNSTEFSGGECGACIAAERDALRNVLDAGKGQSAISILWEQNEKTKAERDTLKGEVGRLGKELEIQKACRNSNADDRDYARNERDSHRLLLDEMAGVIEAEPEGHTRDCDGGPYDCNCGETDRMKRRIATLTKYQQQCGEKVKL